MMNITLKDHTLTKIIKLINSGPGVGGSVKPWLIVA